MTSKTPSQTQGIKTLSGVSANSMVKSPSSEYRQFIYEVKVNLDVARIVYALAVLAACVLGLSSPEPDKHETRLASIASELFSLKT
jgi:hypothetical protein